MRSTVDRNGGSASAGVMPAETPGRPPRLAAPTPPDDWIPLRKQFLRPRIAYNEIARFPNDAYERLILRPTFHDRDFLLVNEPDLIRHILQTNPTNYVRPGTLTDVLLPLVGRGLLTTDDEQWRRQRRAVSPAFRPDRLRTMVPNFATTANALADRWDQSASGAPIDIFSEMIDVSLQIVAHNLFGDADDPRLPRIAGAIVRYTYFWRFVQLMMLAGMPYNAVMRIATAAAPWLVRPMKQYADKLARQPPDEPADKNLLALMLRAQHRSDGATLDGQEVRDEIATMLIAGHETTAAALAWVWYLLALHPAVRDRLEAELEQVLGGRDPTAEDLERLTYARMVVDEALRLYPTVPVFKRLARSADEAGNVAIPAGARITFAPWVLHRHRLLWSQPEVFDPDRFAPERKAAIGRFSYLPFGAGPRVCIGAGLAVLEITAVAVVIAQRYRARLVPGQRIEPVAGIALRPRHGIHMVLERRSTRR